LSGNDVARIQDGVGAFWRSGVPTRIAAQPNLEPAQKDAPVKITLGASFHLDRHEFYE